MNVEMNHLPRRKRIRRTRLFPFILLSAFIMSLFVTGTVWYLERLPNSQKAAPFNGQAKPITYQGNLLPKESGKIQDGELYLSMNFIKEHMDPEIYWDEPSKSVIITTKDKVLQFPDGQLKGFMNGAPFSLHVPAQELDGQIYIPFKPLEKIYPFRMSVVEDTGVVKLQKLNQPVQLGEIIQRDKDKEPASAKLRIEPTEKSPYITEISPGQTVEIYGEKNGWYLIQNDQGFIGFMNKNEIALTDIKQEAWEFETKEKIPWKPLGGKINLTWEHVVQRNPDHQKIPSMPGLNVISPTWFDLKNGEGDITSKASLPYVEWAHQQGYQVWALFSNNFNPDYTAQALSSYETRSKMIRQLLQYAEMYRLDGINLDFENVYLKDKDHLVQFVRELTPYLHEQDLVVSMDVTIKSQSERWSLFYDRPRLAQTVDYIIVMTYDEHWASSPKAGSVASLPWVENGLRGMLEEVPASKLVLGVPFYTRLWKEERDGSGQVKVSSKALSMGAANKWIQERGLTPVYDEASGQMYVEHHDKTDGAVYKMWIEDDMSMKKRVALVKKYNLAGIASWRRGFEQPGIWETISEAMTQRP